MLSQEKDFNDQLSENAEGLKVDSTRKKEIVTWYKARMKEYLNALNVGVLERSRLQFTR